MSHLHARISAPSAHRRRHRSIVSAVNRVPLLIEQMERRTLMSISTVGVADWVEPGPGPTTGEAGRRSGRTSQPGLGRGRGAGGHPTNANILYAAAVNGGIWRTTERDRRQPHLDTAHRPVRLALHGAIAFDPLDATANTLSPPTAAFSSGGRSGADSGMLRRPTAATPGIRSTETRSTATPIARSSPPIVTGTEQVVLVAATDGGIFRSADGGNDYTQIIRASRFRLAHRRRQSPHRRPRKQPALLRRSRQRRRLPKR